MHGDCLPCGQCVSECGDGGAGVVGEYEYVDGASGVVDESERVYVIIIEVDNDDNIFVTHILLLNYYIVNPQ